MKKIALIALIFAYGLMAEEIKECKTKADTLTSCVLTLKNGTQRFYENGEYVRKKEKIEVTEYGKYLGYYFEEMGYDNEESVWIKRYYSDGNLCYSWEDKKFYKLYDKNGKLKEQGIWEKVGSYSNHYEYQIYDKDGQAQGSVRYGNFRESDCL